MFGVPNRGGIGAGLGASLSADCRCGYSVVVTKVIGCEEHQYKHTVPSNVEQRAAERRRGLGTYVGYTTVTMLQLVIDDQESW